MNASVKKELLKDLVGLAALLIFLGTVFLAAFSSSPAPGPVGAVASLPLIVLVAFSIRRKYRTFYRRSGHA
jgi:hypothetical protein